MHRKLHISLLLWLAASVVGAQEAPPVAERPWLERAREIGWWLRSLEQQHGSIPVDALTPDAERDDLASGVAGQILFWVALGRATGEYESRAALERAADGLLARLPTRLERDAFPPATSLYYGLAGQAWALDLAARETGNPLYAEGARAAVRTLIDQARPDASGRLFWDERYDELLFGNTGTALFLLYAASNMGMHEALQPAVGQGDRLIELARRDQGGLSWSFQRDRPELDLPNFSHGTAGIGYFLATLSMLSGDRRHLQAARSAAEHLRGIARTDLGGVAFPYGFGDEAWEGVVELGWAHGVSGSARLFQRLHQLDGDPQLDAVVEGCATAVLRSNVPFEPGLGFARVQTMDRRFGLAGIGEFLIARARQTGDGGHLAQAEDIARAIVDAALLEQAGLAWETPRPAFAERPGEPARFTGYLTGAIGYGLFFLQLDAALSGALNPVPCLDDPFAFVPVQND